MSMWMLTEEKKNELLKQRDTKLSELESLRKKTPEMLWLDDLDALESKLNEVEEKERAEEQGINLKTAKALKGQKSASAKGRKVKSMGGGAGAGDVFPDPDGEPVEFKITEEIIKKMAAAAKVAQAAKEPKKPKEPKEPKVKKEPKGKQIKAEPDASGDEVDEFDAMVEGGSKTSPKAKKAVVKKEPGEKKPRQKKENGGGLKQSKIDFSKAKVSVSVIAHICF